MDNWIESEKISQYICKSCCFCLCFLKKCLLCTLSKEIHTVSCTQIDSYLFNKDVSEPTAEWLEDEPVLERR